MLCQPLSIPCNRIIWSKWSFLALRPFGYTCTLLTKDQNSLHRHNQFLFCLPPTLRCHSHNLYLCSSPQPKTVAKSWDMKSLRGWEGDWEEDFSAPTLPPSPPSRLSVYLWFGSSVDALLSWTWFSLCREFPYLHLILPKILPNITSHSSLLRRIKVRCPVLVINWVVRVIPVAYPAVSDLPHS